MGFGTVMNKMHAINLDIDGLCQILLCIQILITSIKSLNFIVTLHCVILSPIYISILHILFTMIEY